MITARVTEGSGDGSTPFSARTAWARNLETPLREFLRTETGGAAVPLAATVAALAWVNIDAGSYDSFWSTKLSIGLGSAEISLDLRDWVNSGLMTFSLAAHRDHLPPGPISEIAPTWGWL